VHWGLNISWVGVFKVGYKAWKFISTYVQTIHLPPIWCHLQLSYLFYSIIDIVHTHEHWTTNTKMKKHVTFYLNKPFQISLETKGCLHLVGEERHVDSCSKDDHLWVVCCWWHFKKQINSFIFLILYYKKVKKL